VQRAALHLFHTHLLLPFASFPLNVVQEETFPSRGAFRELQRLSPGRYHPLQIRTLQRGMRKIRAYLLETFEEQWQDEVIRGPCLQTVSSAENEALVT
jgi:hypothetical protein